MGFSTVNRVSLISRFTKVQEVKRLVVKKIFKKVGHQRFVSTLKANGTQDDVRYLVTGRRAQLNENKSDWERVTSDVL